MPTTGDPGMQERLERVEMKVDHLETKVNGLEIKVDRLETKVDGLGTKVDRLDDKMDAQGRRFDVQMEDLRSTIVTFAENIGGRMDGIAHQLSDSQASWETKFSDHALTLRDHGRRITMLERRQRK